MENIIINESRSKRNLLIRIISFSWIKRNTIVEFISILFISMFIYTALSKWSDYTMTREQMALMPLLTPVAHILVWLLPATEISISILIFISKTRRIGVYAATTLMTMFTLYIIYMMIYHQNLPCSCGGFMNALSWPGHLIFNGVYILLGIVALLLTRKNKRK